MEILLIGAGVVLVLILAIGVVAQRAVIGDLREEFDQTNKALLRANSENKRMEAQIASLKADREDLKRTDDKVISDLTQKIESADAKAKVTEQEAEIEDLNDELTTKDARIAELEKELEKAQRNDMPQDPDTGKFVSKKKKTATKKKATAKKGK